LDNSTLIKPYQYLQYYSYPRSKIIVQTGEQHYYLSHDIHAVPDFDHVVHALIDHDSCFCPKCKNQQDMFEFVHAPGASWSFVGIQNSLAQKLIPQQAAKAHLLSIPSNFEVDCKLIVLEEIHCVVGPAFYNTC